MALALAATPPPMPLFMANFSVPVARMEPFPAFVPPSLPTTRAQPIRSEVPRPTSLPPGKPKLNQGGLNGFFQTAFHEAKNLIDEVAGYVGFNKECMNGGTRMPNGQCACTKLYKGALCEEIVCVNEGKRVRVDKLTPPQYVCKCPWAEFISGKHCEKVTCQNGGKLLGNASCECVDYWHTGRFCENLRYNSWPVLLIPITVIFLVLLCCFICRMDWCPRRPTRSRRRNHERGDGYSRRRPVTTNRPPRTRIPPMGALIQEQLLGEERGAPMRGPAYPPGVVAPYVIRLDTIPTFNPGMVGGVDPGGGALASALEIIKEIDPPPSYDQAMAAPRPPDYTPSSEEARRSRRAPESGSPAPPTSAPPTQPPPNFRQNSGSPSTSTGSQSSQGNSGRVRLPRGPE